MAIKELRVYNPADASPQPGIQHVGSEKEVISKAEACLAELRGKMYIRKTKDGDEVIQSGWQVPKAKNINAVAIYHRSKKLVRHLDLSNQNPGAISRMGEILVGEWRLATDAEEKEACDGWEAERQRVKKEADRALERPAELIGEKLGEKLAEFADTLNAAKKKG